MEHNLPNLQKRLFLKSLMLIWYPHSAKWFRLFLSAVTASLNFFYCTPNEPPFFGTSLFSSVIILHIHPTTRTLFSPDLTLQLNQISSPNGDIKKLYSNKKFYLKTTEKLVIRPNCQKVSSCELTSDDLPLGTNAIIEPLPTFQYKTDL